MALAQTLQFGWFVGHLTLLLTTARYALAVVKFSSHTKIATVSYRLGFLSAVVTYGIVVYKAYRPRIGSGQMPRGKQGVLKVLEDENVQYLFMALVWLSSKPVFNALLPFSVYSAFHFLTYLRTSLIPTIFPPVQPVVPGLKQSSGVSDKIAKFVRNNYDYSMHLVANLELLLWARIFVGAIIFMNSWILLAIYTIFLRARYSQSSFVRDSLKKLELKGNAIAADNNVPDGVKSAWSAVKGAVKSFGEVTDHASKYIWTTTANGAAQKKAQ